MENYVGDAALTLVRASEEEVRQWQAAEGERRRDAIMKAAGAHSSMPTAVVCVLLTSMCVPYVR